MKKTTTIKIEEELLNRAKAEIPNLSAFVSICLEKYLGVGDAEFPISDIQDELNNMKESNLNIHLLTEKDYSKDVTDEMIISKNNKVWLNVWSHYRNSKTVYEPALVKSANVLGCEPEELREMMETILYYAGKDKIMLCDEYSYARELYEQYK